MNSLNIDIVITIISEYIGRECIKFLCCMNVMNKYYYLYYEFSDHDANMYFVNVRYLTINYDISKLHKYTNLRKIRFGDKFNQPIEKNVIQI